MKLYLRTEKKKSRSTNNESELRKYLCNFIVPFVSDVPIVVSDVAQRHRLVKV